MYKFISKKQVNMKNYCFCTLQVPSGNIRSFEAWGKKVIFWCMRKNSFGENINFFKEIFWGLGRESAPESPIIHYFHHICHWRLKLKNCYHKNVF